MMTTSSQTPPASSIEMIRRLEPNLLQLGDSGTAVQNLQHTLAALDVYHGTIDGQYCARTEKAIIKIQKILGLEATGRFDAATWYGLTFWIEDLTPSDLECRSVWGQNYVQQVLKFFRFAQCA